MVGSTGNSSNIGYNILPPIVEEMAETGGSTRQPPGDNTGFFVCWGCGEFGQHCHGSKQEVTFQNGVVEKFCGQNASRVKLVGCGSSHTIVVTNSNEVYVWGNGNSGQLGCNNLDTQKEPKKIELYTYQTAPPKIAGVSCGSRHTMVWLENGHVFSFGNNFFAQLGYDFKEKNYKENQVDNFWDIDGETEDHYVTQPTLLKFLTHRPVAQIACGDKHTLFRFKDGAVAGVGNNSNGQLGTDNKEDSVVPKLIGSFQQPIKMIAAGSHHSLAVTDSGEVYVWGYGKACGSKTDDILIPTKQMTHRNNILAVAGGSTHSMALTGNGSVYTWGSGIDGQLGHGENITFLEHPKRLKDRHVTGKVIQIGCGETYSAAVTGKGLLYLWGKNSHTIYPGQPTTKKIFLPLGMNKNFRGGRVKKVFCGSWHAAAILGRPALLLRDDEDSGISEDEQIEAQNKPSSKQEIHPSRTTSMTPAAMTPAIPEEQSPRNELESPLNIIPVREKTQMSLADFYAPTPDIPREARSPSPEFYYLNSEESFHDAYVPASARSHTLVVQVPGQPVMSYADAATSPMTLSTTTGSKSSSQYSHSRVPTPVLDLPKTIKPVKRRYKEFEPTKYEKPKVFSQPIAEIVQVSKTSADAFTLPREPTQITRKHVDFSELEESRLSSGWRSAEMFSRLSNKNRDFRDQYSPNLSNSPARLKETYEKFDRLRNLSPVRSRLRHIDNSLAFKSESVLMDSPLFKSNRNSNTNNQPKVSWCSTEQEEERQYKHHVPKQIQRKYSRPKQGDSNFSLQISRTKTIVTPMLADPLENADRIAQLKRYAAVHNPQGILNRGVDKPDKLRPVKPRHVSIPTGRPDSPVDDVDKLCIGSPIQTTHKPPSFSSGSAWKDKNDIDKLPSTYRKGVAAGIVKMFIKNNEVIGTVEKPLYTSLSDGRGHVDDLNDKDPFIVQSLLKSPIKLSNDEFTLGLPNITLGDKKRRDKHKGESNVTLPTSSRVEATVDSRVS